MTMAYPSKERCSVCGRLNEFCDIVSSHTMGPPDLDSRPAEMMRSTLVYTIHKCKNCGYCTTSIEDKLPAAEEIVMSPEYTAQAADTGFTKLANLFLCHALILDISGKPADAGWQTLKAAWSCDDGKLVQGSRLCRKAAILRFEKARKTEPVIDQPGAEELLLADLYRRIGRFDRALELCEAGLAAGPEETLRKALQAEMRVSSECRTACYTMDEQGNPVPRGKPEDPQIDPAQAVEIRKRMM